EYVVAANGRRVYFVGRGKSTIWWMPLGDGGTWKGNPQPTGLPAAGSSLAQPALSADGRQVAWTVLEVSNHLWASEGASGDRDRHAGAAPLTRGLGVRYGLPAVASDGRIA